MPETEISRANMNFLNILFRANWSSRWLH